MKDRLEIESKKKSPGYWINNDKIIPYIDYVYNWKSEKSKTEVNEKFQWEVKHEFSL